METKVPDIIKAYLKKHNRRNTEVYVKDDAIYVDYNIGGKWCNIIRITPTSITVQTDTEDPTETLFDRINDVFKALKLHEVGFNIYPAGHRRKTWRCSFHSIGDAYWGSTVIFSKRKYGYMNKSPMVYPLNLRNLMHLLNALSKVGGVHPYTGESLQNAELEQAS